MSWTASVLSSMLLVAVEGCAAHVPCTSIPESPRLPPIACHVDGCTMAPDLDFASCCNAHDEQYWLGGTAESRLAADGELRQCIADHGHPGLANIYYFGVRVLGSPLLPTPWRWGFGWPYLHRQCEPPAEPGLGGDPCASLDGSREKRERLHRRSRRSRPEFSLASTRSRFPPKGSPARTTESRRSVEQRAGSRRLGSVMPC